MKYRSLDEVYLTGTRKAKPTPPSPKKYQPVTESYRKVVENYMLQITNMDGTPVYSSEIADDKLEAIQRDIERQQKIAVGDEQFTSSDIVSHILEACGWATGSTKTYKRQILEPIKALFHEANINLNNFGDLIDVQTDQDNLFRTQLLANPMVPHNYHQLISPKVWSLFASQQDALDVLDGVWDIDPKISNVSVGKGEIAITMFSDATKGTHGDLQFEGIGEVELKGCGARAGGDGYGHTTTVKSLNEILQSRDVEISVYQLDLIKQDVIGNLTNRIQAPQTSEEGRIDVQKFHDFVNTVTTADDLNQVLASIEASEAITPTWKDEFRKKIQKYQKYLAGDVKGVYKDAVGVFFRSEWNLTRDEIVQGLIECRNYGERIDLNSLRTGIEQIVDSGPDILDATGYMNKTDLARLIAAIHITCYQSIENFKLIVFGNDSNKDMVCVDFPYVGDLGQTVVDLYSKLIELDISVTLSVDVMAKSVGMTFGGSCPKQPSGD